MSISEFCKKFNVAHQAVHDKMKNHAAELEGHITKDERNVTDLDPYAVELLKPNCATYKAKLQKFEDKQSAKQDASKQNISKKSLFGRKK